MYCKFFKYARGKTIVCDCSKNGIETFTTRFTDEKTRLNYYRDFCNRPKCTECKTYQRVKGVWENGY